MNATAFGSAVAGVATANAITSDSSADATGHRDLVPAPQVGRLDGHPRRLGRDVGRRPEPQHGLDRAGAAVAVTAFTLTESKG
jgi:hypothetical protein